MFFFFKDKGALPAVEGFWLHWDEEEAKSPFLESEQDKVDPKHSLGLLASAVGPSWSFVHPVLFHCLKTPHPNSPQR